MSYIDTRLLQDLLLQFEPFMQAEGEAWLQERTEKDAFFQAYFTKEALLTLDEGTLRELIHILWAFNNWTNKDYLLQEMLKSGLDHIIDAFQFLLSVDAPLPSRYDYMREHVRMMGAAGISEILAHHNPQTYPIWNSRAKQGLIALGIPETALPKSTQISGNQYQAFTDLVQLVLAEIQQHTSLIRDVFELDFLLYYISRQHIVRPRPPGDLAAMTLDEFDHDTVVEQVLELGDGLGFEVQKEFNVTHGCRIDAIWRTRIANLGTISYAFEIHRKGSRDSAILNLQKVIRWDSSIQKVVIVSSREELDIFRREISALGEDFRNAVGYFSVDELQVALLHLNALKNMLDSIGLLAKMRTY